MPYPSAARDFPVVCVGGSAGALKDYVTLLSHLPSDTGVAVVIVNHIRSQQTRLHQILPRHTEMPVVLISEKLEILPNHVYIIPAAQDLHVHDGVFHLLPMSKPVGWPDVITIFLRSLANEWKGLLIAVILSGYDGDGAEALRYIQEVGGLTIAQAPDSAAQADMPVSAIKSGYVNFILTPEKIAQKIGEIAKSYEVS